MLIFKGFAQKTSLFCAFWFFVGEIITTGSFLYFWEFKDFFHTCGIITAI